jgi:hypothetical protein
VTALACLVQKDSWQYWHAHVFPSLPLQLLKKLVCFHEVLYKYLLLGATPAYCIFIKVFILFFLIVPVQHTVHTTGINHW